ERWSWCSHTDSPKAVGSGFIPVKTHTFSLTSGDHHSIEVLALRPIVKQDDKKAKQSSVEFVATCYARRYWRNRQRRNIGEGVLKESRYVRKRADAAPFVVSTD